MLARRDGSATAQPVMTSQPSRASADDEFDRVCLASGEAPALRHRYGDTEHLARFFLRKYRPSGDSRFSTDALTMLQRCPWPENVRQLESVIRGLARPRARWFTPTTCRRNAGCRRTRS
ncbi:hypothetical protein ACQEV9_45230 [Streptomyces chartreusis]|uniref:hypothetical protein n=1 Tax=Streptomyces chartreusis TaxID=1969 RepID=UPI003D939C4B